MRRDEVRNQVRDNYPLLDFWSDHPGWAAWRISRPYGWAAWGALTGWVGYGWSEPVYYAYGDNVYYDDGSVYYDDQLVASAEDYALQAEEICESAPPLEPEKAEWMPLGVFALAPDGASAGPTPSLFLQLAVSKDGFIGGNLYNAALDSTKKIEGKVDKQSQRAVWASPGIRRPFMETGIINLTEDQSPVLVHFGDGETQQWLMVRLPEPAPASP